MQKNNKFIVIEGLDGSGKSTQINLLKKHLEKQNIKYKYLHFPRTDSEIYGDLIAKFLRGELGDINAVSPYLVALLYAGDRDNAKTLINNWLKDDYLVIVDRYVNSNIAFQCAKLTDDEEKNKLRKWINHLEYEHFKIPKPDLSIFVDVPFAFTSQKLTEQRTGDDRDYLKGKKDIHEENIDFQYNVKKEYLKIVNSEAKFELIDCSKDENTILSPDEIFEKIISVLEL